MGRKIVFLGVSLAFWCDSVSAVSLGTEQIASGLTEPLFVTAAPGDESRIFILEKRGLIKIVTLNNNSVLPQPFLDLTGVVTTSGEQGLLGLAFHPSYASNGFFYVYHTVADPRRSRISRFTVEGSPATSNLADATSELIVLEFNQPFTNHNAGMMAFGPNDGYLYIASGDGGDANDPDNNGQRLNTLLGKILRIDVNEGGEGAGTGGSNYDIPPSNPDLGGRPEIWAYGLRNPWRMSFDRETGNLWIGDVGQNQIEEVDLQPFNSVGGVNYGWRLKEGSQCFNPSTNCDPGGITTDPIHEYNHTVGNSVIGGYVYRGDDIPFLRSHYVFADLSGPVWSFLYFGGVLDFSTWSADVNPSGRLISSFGEDARGELYVCYINHGSVHRIIATDNEIVYVDFDATGLPRGTLDRPFTTVATGLESVAEAGTVRFLPGETPETLAINQNVRLESDGGTVRIGATSKSNDVRTGFVSAMAEP